MKALQNIYVLNITPPAAIVDNTSFTTAEIDTVQNGVKYNYLTILVSFGAMDIAMAALKVQNGDTSGSLSDLTGAVGGTDFTLPSATSDNTIWAFHFDCVGKGRYFDLVATGGDGAAGTYMSAIAILSNAAEVPITATAKGLAQEIIL